MEKQLIELVLPEGLLDYFEVEAVKTGVNSEEEPSLRIYLTEKNIIPKGYDASEYESKGFFDPKTISDFPIRGRFVYLVIKRRRWRHKTDPNRIIFNDYSFLAEGTKMTRDLAAFLKGAGRNAP